MKRLVIIFGIFIFPGANSIGQTIDTTFVFDPPLISKTNKISRLDSLKIGRYNVSFHKDCADEKCLQVRISDENGNLREEGRYKLDTTISSYNTIHNINTGDSRNEIARLQYKYLRDGYWKDYKKKRQKEIFYNEGRAMKRKIRD